MREINTNDKRFHDGDGRSEMGTIVTADWLNAVQDELVALVTGLGGEVNGDVSNQIYTLIKNAFDKKSSVSVISGVVANGATLPLPSGYTEQQCRWIVSINEDVALDRIDHTNTGYTKTECYVGNNRKVVAKVYSKAGAAFDSVTGKKFDNSRANYLVIGVK